jgi:hypothetical protein
MLNGWTTRADPNPRIAAIWLYWFRKQLPINLPRILGKPAHQDSRLSRGSPRVTTSATGRRLLEGVLSRALSVTMSSTTYASSFLDQHRWQDQCAPAQGEAQTAITGPNHLTTNIAPVANGQLIMDQGMFDIVFPRRLGGAAQPAPERIHQTRP